MSNNKIRWAIAGLGKVAHRFAADLTQHANNDDLYAVAARDKGRASAFSKVYGCEVSYGSYCALAKDANVNVVYVATIHPLHKCLVELF